MDHSQYNYNAMSNLVIQADKRFVGKRGDEPTGEPTSLAGKIDPKEMGSRARRPNPTEKKLPKDSSKPKKEKKNKYIGYANVIEATEDLEGLLYRPRTKETSEIYEKILAFVHEDLGDQSQDIVRSAGDAVLEILKSDGLKDLDKKKECERILGATMSSEKFALLVNLGRKITDYGADEEEKMRDVDDDGEIDDEQGVAVILNESESEEESDEDSQPDVADDAAEPGYSGVVIGDEEVKDSDPEVIDRTIVGDVSKVDNNAEDKVSAHGIDAFWLQRTIAAQYQDPYVLQEKTSAAMEILRSTTSIGEIENGLMELFEFENHKLVQLLAKNRDAIVWCTQIDLAPDADARRGLEIQMEEQGLSWLLRELRGDRNAKDVTSQTTAKPDADAMDVDDSRSISRGKVVSESLKPSTAPIDLESLAFTQGGRLMTNKQVKLPEGTTKREKKGYEEIHVPAPPQRPIGDQVTLDRLPAWTKAIWPPGMTHLNPVQSKIFPVAFGTDENILICAPTGAGKTNCALLCIINELAKYRNSDGSFNTENFKIVYIAPLKALVQEMVENFTKALDKHPYNVKVAELTGDRQLTKLQISQTQIIVTTPEKWDVITRKATDTSYTNLVRLIIIDEIHLLHDDRGPVLESIVARTLRKMEQTLEPVRLVGLSATLPNFNDVATFLRVDQQKGLFYFDASHRPCPLQQQFIGITEKKGIKRLQTMNECAYEKCLEYAGREQVLVFVHSRKETAKTAKYIKDKALEEETITKFLRSDAGAREALAADAEDSKDGNLRELLPYGFAIHHAGMTRADRTSVEELFKKGLVQVLVSTATLAWGVNLPAHTVIIKGTQIYSPEKGRWIELSPQDVIQMLGRAGRPGYDTYGEGIIITAHSELQYYLSLMNQQLPIESQFVGKLADNFNAEIVLGTVRSMKEAVEWLGYTYLYIRMRKSPGLYAVGADYADDTLLEQKRVDLIFSAAVKLRECGLLVYNEKTGRFQSTELGRIAAHYYINHDSMLAYAKSFRPKRIGRGPEDPHVPQEVPFMSFIELFRIFSESAEFKYIPVREDEKMELAKLIERVPIPVEKGVDDPKAKINVLLQAYISRLKLEGFALVADMVYVTQSAGRILRAVFEIALKLGYAQVAKQALDMCKMVDQRMWMTMSPLRQFTSCPADVIRRVERKDFPWTRYFDLDPPEMGELLGLPKFGRLVHGLVHKFPRLKLQAHVQPITRSLLRIELSITPDFQWDEAIHGFAEQFWIIAEDSDGERILFHDSFVLRQKYATDEHIIDLTVSVSDPIPPNYFITVVSDRWMHSETKLPVSFRHLILPKKYPPPTELLELQSLQVNALRKPEFVSIYSSTFKHFNKIQTQTFNTLYNTDDNVFIGAPTGSGKTVCAEFALLRHWSKADSGRAVYIAPTQDQVDQRHGDWKERLGNIAGGRAIVMLTGELSADLKLLEQGDLILATPLQWDVVSRRWRQRKNVHTVKLYIVDDLHMLGYGQNGSTYEVIVSRMRYVAAQLEVKSRIVALSVSLANARDLGEWIGANKQTVYNFSPEARSIPLEVSIQSFTIPHFPSLMLAMAKPTYLAISTMSTNKPAIIFVSSRKQARATALELLTFCAVDDDEDRFLIASKSDLKPHLNRLEDKGLAEALEHGIGYIHESLSKNDRHIVEHLYENRAFLVLLASREVCWSIKAVAHMVVIMGTQYYEGREHRYIDYPLCDVLQMFGKAGRAHEDALGRAVLMTPAVKKEYYNKFLKESLPIESHLQHFLHDAFVTETSTKTIENKQDAVDWITWTYMYRRLDANPGFYGLQDVSHGALSDFLSDLVENTLNDLVEAKVINIEDDVNIEPLNQAMISAYYNITYITMQTFQLSLTERTKLKGLLEIITSAAEFEDLPIRHHEDIVLKRIYDRIPVKLSQPDFESPHFKAFVLLQAHFSRLALPPDLVVDQSAVLSKVLNLLSACVDAMSSEGFFNAIYAMEMSQMCVQAIWDRDSPLKQVPHFTLDVLERCKEAGVESVFDIMDLDDKRDGILQMDARQLAAVATFANKYPNLELTFELEGPDEITSGTQTVIKIDLVRETDDEDDVDTIVHAPFYPLKKMESWYLVIADPVAKALFGIKRVTLNRRLSVKMDFVVPTAGKKNYVLYCICDSYAGCDQEFPVEFTAAQGEEESENEDAMDED
ncbi:Pre-mRNA-splicing factor brr2 [Neolecta irregularis DAH-3]|uniref:RNA helicase n=1 Tax=Neolecta irregularis (strain DAH-3) TaxID=1198029 RepID=A0A1U7LH60_NEOID|nr:Pre-mRNA-splicing factor brr2 [Neolecta irregularis DAH-3]|eukprot:OLL21933.1 Pre-mRNA-splicing factor brr2 [Neolecta irregularis DAH-3]